MRRSFDRAKRDRTSKDNRIRQERMEGREAKRNRMIRKKTVEAWMDVIVYAVLKVYQNLKNKGNSKVWKQMLAIAFFD